MLKQVVSIVMWSVISFIFFSVNAQNTGTFIDDRDGMEYATTIIGEQTWMAQNLNYETDTCWHYSEDNVNGDKYGFLYRWEDAQNICPEGWHLPTKQELDTLVSFLGGKWKAGGKLKATGSNYWEWPNKGATNEFNFNALPTDIRLLTGGYVGILKSNAEYWSATEVDVVSAHTLKLYSSITLADITKAYKTTALSVRCIKNEELDVDLK